MTDTTAYKALRSQVSSDLNQRIAVHRAAMGRRMTGVARVAPGPLNIIATGDSWFNYPLNNGLPGDTDIIAQLPSLLRPQTQILNLAHYGDATTAILGTSKRAVFVEQLNDAANGRFDAILFSGGGNDLIGDAFRFWLRDALSEDDDPATAMNGSTFNDIISIVVAAYQDLIAIRDAYDMDVPIFIHGYDFAYPDNRGAYCIGPWLYPSLVSRGWMNGLAAAQVARGAAAVRAFMLAFNAQLEALTARPNVILVATQGTLQSEQEWANELHPTPGGFAKMAAKFAAALEAKFPGRAMVVG
jgi:hypothetical protein